MGMGAFIPLMLASTAASIGTGIYGAEVKKNALRQEEKEQNIATDQQRIAEDKKIERVLSSQKAQEAAGPFSTSSQTFGAINEESLNNFSEDRHMTTLNLEMKEANIKQEISNTTGKEFLGVVNNLFDAGMMYYRVKHLGTTTNVSPDRYDNMENI